MKSSVSDERLGLIASGIADRLAAGASAAPDLERDIASAITELLALRAIPRGGVKITPAMKSKAAEILTQYGVSSGAYDLGHDLLQQVLALAAIGEQEPVAWRWRVVPGGWNYTGHPALVLHGATVEPLYLSPSVCEGKVTEEWQPIDTAPQDVEIFVWSPTAFRVGHRFIARWNPDRYAVKQRPFWDFVGQNISLSRAHPPSLWVPMPSPPGALSQEGV